MTTTQTPAPLPFLLPAANLTVGDITSTGTVGGLEVLTSGDIRVGFTDESVAVLKPDFLVEVQRRSAVQALRAELTALADEWVLGAAGLRGEAHELGETDPDARRLFNRADERHECARQLRALLARLQA